MEQQYSASLTGEPFLYFELKQVARLKLLGLTNEEIRKRISGENLFQYATNKSVGRILRATLKRAEVLDDTLLDILVQGSLSMSKLVALITIMKTNLLFFEFMEEVYLEKALLGEKALESKDFRIFFMNKAEQSARVAEWQEYTCKKLSQVYANILMGAGLIKSIKEKVLTPPLLDEDLLEHLQKCGDQKIINIISGGRM